MKIVAVFNKFGELRTVQLEELFCNSFVYKQTIK